MGKIKQQQKKQAPAGKTKAGVHKAREKGGKAGGKQGAAASRRQHPPREGAAAALAGLGSAALNHLMDS